MRGKYIAAVSHGLDQLEFDVAELSTNPAEQHVDGAIEGIAVAAVGGVQQIFARQHPSGPRHQCMQEVEFGRGQVKQFTAGGKNAPQGRLQPETLETVFLGRMDDLVRAILTSEHRSNASCEFARIEWLGEIIVGADLKADDPVDVLFQGGEKNDRNVRVLGTHVPAYFQARSVRQHDIEHDQFDVVRVQRGLEGALVGRERHPKPLLGEISAEKLTNLEVVIDDQDMLLDVHPFTSSSTPSPIK